MSKIKYHTGITQLHGKNEGSCIQGNSQLPTMRGNPRMKQFRTNNQTFSEVNTGYFVRIWRMLSSEVRQNWIDFASAFPQRAKASDLVFLTGFELFVKRHFYLNLFSTSQFQLMPSPVMISYPQDFANCEVQVSNDKIYLVVSFTNADSLLTCHIFISKTQSPGRYFINSSSRYMCSVSNVNQTVDITDRFIACFGRLPVPGDNIFLKSVLCGTLNGQFWPQDEIRLSVSPYVPPRIPVKYGFAYNILTVRDASLLPPVGWHYPNYLTELVPLINYLGGTSVAGGHMKSSGTDYWLSPNAGADNSSLLTFKGIGTRSPDGTFSTFKQNSFMACATPSYNPSISVLNQLNYASASAFISATTAFKLSTCIRLVCDDPNFSGFFTDNAGRKYLTQKINGVVWMAENLACSKLRDNSVLPFLESNSDWSSTSYPGYCFPNGSVNNV